MIPPNVWQELTFACMDDLHKKTGKPVIITCGANGVAVDHNGEKMVVPAVKQPGPIDICGAGDATNAGIAFSRALGLPLAESALVASAVSSITIKQIGVTGTASPDEVCAVLRGYCQKG